MVLIVLSPAKSLDYESPLATTRFTQPRMLPRSEALIKLMETKTPGEIGKLMSISPALSELNYERYQSWKRPFTKKHARAALLAFDGDVYDGMSARTTFTEADFDRAQTTLRILSGLYGVLRPLDLMLPYRLEMGTRLPNTEGRDLYAFWGDEITNMLKADMKKSPGDKVLINLASEEYFGSVRPSKLGAPVVSPRFLDGKGNGDAKVISFFAKKARGVMASWLIREQITSADQLPKFVGAGYEYDPDNSTEAVPVFIRSTDQ
jgi:uncharacterized protein